MKLIDIEPKVKALEEGLANAHERIDLMLEREKQILERLEQVERDLQSHTHDETPTLLEEVVETVEEAAEEVADVVEEVVDTINSFGQQVKEGSDGGDATFPEEKTETKVKVEPVPEANDAPPVDYVEVLNKETGKTHRIHRNLLAQIVEHD